MGVPHFSVPFRVDGTGRFVTVEQDTPEEIAQCVAVIIGTPEGSRVEVPDFGCPRAEFVGPDPAGIVAAVEDWEPRAVLSVEVVAGLGLGGSLTELTGEIRPNI